MNGGNESDIIIAKSILSLDHDCSTGRIYWFTYAKKEIWSAKYDGTDQTVFAGRVSRSYGLAVDWISRRLYWSNYKKGTINVASLDNPDQRTVLISHLNNPRSIAVDPYRGKLYWKATDAIGVYEQRANQTIEWSNLDGTERQILIGRPLIYSPTDIKVSMATGELCYIDLKIKCIEPNSKQIRTIASHIAGSLALAVTDDMVYWTSSRFLVYNKIERMDANGARQKPISIQGDDLRTITAVTSNCTGLSNACSTDNGGCPENTICLINPYIESGRSCTQLKT
ncbi:AGAP008193-PA-like protein [Anopheles sinensis]|uniref:AGAP008193-PA-like protein n=1 Tax=Anopheles sinensis TaxID=74873 RepID=A0A084VD85_ANOSI|nr:AGAP008193-PA-like protein [Anopheles sinensis]